MSATTSRTSGCGRAENWPLADFYLSETNSHLRWPSVASRSAKDNQGREINLGNILEAFEEPAS